MRKSILFIIFSTTYVLTSCSSWDEQFTNTPFEAVTSTSLAVNTKELTFTDIAENKEFAITSESYWTVQNSAPSWLTLSANHGKGNATINVHALDNPAEARSATIIVSDGLDSYTILVSQAALQEKLILGKSSLSFTFQGGSEDISVEANTVWAVSADVAWLKVTKNNESTAFHLEVTSNISTNSRQGVITVQSKGLTSKVNVTQQGVTAPTISSLSVTDVTKHEAVCKYTFNSKELDVTEYGIYYSNTASTPSSANADALKQSGGGKSGSATFNLTSLKSKTTYYARPYIITALGTTYGETIQFTTKVSSPDEGDNNLPTM